MIASRRIIGAFVGVALVAVAGTAAAHHGWSSYDADRMRAERISIDGRSYELR